MSTALLDPSDMDENAQLQRALSISRQQAGPLASESSQWEHASGLAVEPAFSEASADLQRQISACLSDVTFVPHVPKTNARDAQSAQAREADRETLRQRMYKYALCEREMKGDGNCQFRALADQLYRNPHLHMDVREAVVDQLWAHPELYVEYVMDTSFAEYCQRMRKSGEWGDHLTLQAAADSFGVRINVLTSYEVASFIEIVPHGGETSQVTLYISFWAEVHYNSLYPSASPPPPVPAEKLFGSRRLFQMFNTKPALERPYTYIEPVM